jgi:hypothetical protein
LDMLSDNLHRRNAAGCDHRIGGFLAIAPLEHCGGIGGYKLSRGDELPTYAAPRESLIRRTARV